MLSTYFLNSCMTKSAYFGFRIIKIAENKEKALQKAYEASFLRKVGLSEKFLRVVMCMRKSVLGLGLMKPSTITDMLVLKQYLVHQSSKTKVETMI